MVNGVVDAVLVNDEFAMVKFRKEYLNGLVNIHYLDESEFTFSGKKTTSFHFGKNAVSGSLRRGGNHRVTRFF